MDCSPPGSSVLGDSPGKNTGVGCYSLLQQILLTQGLNPCLLCLLYYGWILYLLSLRGAPAAAAAAAAATAKSLQSCLTLCHCIDCSSPGPSVLGDSPGKNTGVGCHALLQGIFQTQGLNLRLLHLLHWQACHLGSPLRYSNFSSNTSHHQHGYYSASNHRHLLPAAAAKSLQSLTLCNPIDGSPPGSPVPGILQARTLEWVAISFSNAGR